MQINLNVQRVGRVRAGFVVGLAVLTIAMAADSAPPPAKPDGGATIKHTIVTRFPGSHVLDVQPTDISGLYEVFMGDQIVYSDATGDRVLIGNLVDTQTKTNLTQERFNERGKIDFKSLFSVLVFLVVF